MASPGDIREKLRKKHRALQETLAKNRDEDDIQALVPSPKMSKGKLQTTTQELQSSEEDPGETLKRSFRAQRERKKRLLEKSSAQDPHEDDGVEEVPSIQHHSEDEESTEKAAIQPRPPTASLRGHSSKALHSLGSQHLDNFVTRRLQERLKAARTKGETLQEQEAALDPPSRLQGLRDRDTVTRFDPEVDPDRVGRHDAPLSLDTRVKFREGARRTEKGVPTVEEAYNFFTFNFEPEPQESSKKTSRKKQKQKKSEGEDEDEEEEAAEEQEEEDVEGDEDNQDEIEDHVRLHCYYCSYYL